MRVSLPEGIEMVMPGDNVTSGVELIARLRWKMGCDLLSARVAVLLAPGLLLKLLSNNVR